jgi:radical SAM superfamily enzyme YgiQ (UPF0313 family)
MDSAFKRQMAPPLSLLVLGALTPGRHPVSVADENVCEISLGDRPDLVGITVKADTARRSWEIANSYRRKGVPVVLGGIHVTACPEQNAAHADAIVIGEGEGIWGEILRDVEIGRLQPAYRNESPPDLSRTPVPRWDLIDEENYLFTNTLTIGRGCPWRCSFCYSSSPNMPRGYRTKPVPAILEEIRSLGTRHVMFIDDNFIARPAFARRLLRAFRPLGLTWHTAVSADIGRHEDLLDLMAETGCRSLFVGFETLSRESLCEANKEQNRIEEYEHTIEKIHRRGMMVNASVVFGFDSDGPEVFERTTAWMIGHKVETMTAHILTPYPGTELHRQLSAEGRIHDHDLDHYNTSRAVFDPARMSAAELQAGYLQAYSRFYSWSSILRRLPRDGRRCTPYLLFNLLYRKYGRFLSSLAAPGLMRTVGRLGAFLSYQGISENGSGRSHARPIPETRLSVPEPP